jgi:hypothetical protein
MNHFHIVSIIATVCEILGLYLLAREVAWGHRMDESNHENLFLKQLQFLYATQDFDRFFIACRLDEGDSPDVARQMLNQQGSVATKEAVERIWTDQMVQITASLKRWEKQTTPIASGKRRRDLWIGTVLIMAGTTLHLAVEYLPGA